MNNEMANKKTNTPLFKVKCVDDDSSNLTLGKEYVVVGSGNGYYTIENDIGLLQSYYHFRFEIVETPIKDKQEFSVGDKVVINKISDDIVSDIDDGVKVGDVATVTRVENWGELDIRLENPNWKSGWWFSKADVSLVADNNPLDDKSRDYHTLSHQEVVQAYLDGKELEMQYKTGTWVNVIPTNTTLHQLANLNFRLKQSLEDKRKAVIKKLLESKVAVLCKCWDDDDIGETTVAITKIDDDCIYPYMNNCLAYKYAYAIHDNGYEITNV